MLVLGALCLLSLGTWYAALMTERDTTVWATCIERAGSGTIQCQPELAPTESVLDVSGDGSAVAAAITAVPHAQQYRPWFVRLTRGLQSTAQSWGLPVAVAAAVAAVRILRREWGST